MDASSLPHVGADGATAAALIHLMGTWQSGDET